jgi:hypothetical protein
MARVTYGALITELAGSIGGITFHKNGSGNIARLKPNMPMIASHNQALQQSKLNSLVAIWPTLTLVQKNSWINFAIAHPHINEFDESKIVNGFQWFMSCNLNLLQVSEAVIVTAPAYAPPAAPAVFTVTASHDDFYLGWGGATNPTPSYLLCYVSSPIRQTPVKNRRSMFFLNDPYWYNSSILVLRVAYSNQFNLVWGTFFDTAKCSIFIRVKVVQHLTGLSSPYTEKIVKIG